MARAPPAGRTTSGRCCPRSKIWAPLLKLHDIQNDPLIERSDTSSTMCIRVVTEHCQGRFQQILDQPKMRRARTAATPATIRIGTHTDTKTISSTCKHTQIHRSMHIHIHTKTLTWTQTHTKNNMQTLGLHDVT